MKTLKYKHIVKGIVLGCMLMTGTGCDDFLDITPPSDVAPENYLVEESQLAAYTIRYYTDNFPSLNSLYGDDEMATDNATTRNSSNRYLIGEWKTPASGGEWNFNNIYTLNYFIQSTEKNLETGSIKGNSTNIKHYIGEGYFLRAYQYFTVYANWAISPSSKKYCPITKKHLSKLPSDSHAMK